MINRGRPKKLPELKRRIIETLNKRNYPMSVTSLKKEIEKGGFKIGRVSVWKAALDLAASNRIKSITYARAKNKKVFRVFQKI